MFVVMFKQHGALNCQQRVFGPFDSYMDAEDALADGNTIPLLYGQGGREWPEEEVAHDGHRFIEQLEWTTGCIL